MSKLIDFFKILAAPSREGEENQEEAILAAAEAENITADVRDELIKVVHEVNKKSGKNATVDIEDVKHMATNSKLKARVNTTERQKDSKIKQSSIKLHDNNEKERE